ncbi:glutaredoxin family protein [Virgibacillus halodenitrificans]|uniref:Glutaredoxin family protein n=1 Tax=Virgibacillus halodenitrificans TaxID=1482 RepID=A0ABR7VQT6_VIRHA|nr:glutaredoxin family protein [Virgibacillus halodenitrificans]MBD1223625.1 glutaredoxin family protein [Virgibacillus halodenitrificans]
MEDKLELELYTRPTCSDCQDAKKYLTGNNIHYMDKDVSKNLSLEEDLKKISGSRIVPLFAFYKKGLFGKRKLVNHFVGFENNKDEILSMLRK